MWLHVEMSTRHHTGRTGRRNAFEELTGRLKRAIGISLAIRLRAKQNRTKQNTFKKKRKKQSRLAGDVTEERGGYLFRSLHFAYARVNFQE